MFVEVNGLLLNTASFGSGSKTLLAHGGWVASWELWQQPMELLSDQWRCVSYDHRGAGLSVVPIEQITLQGCVDDVIGVMDALRIERCIVAGESLGAPIVISALLRHPERFEGWAKRLDIGNRQIGRGSPSTSIIQWLILYLSMSTTRSRLSRWRPSPMGIRQPDQTMFMSG